MHNLIIERNYQLNTENLASSQSFPPFGEVVVLVLSQHFRSSEVAMADSVYASSGQQCTPL